MDKRYAKNEVIKKTWATENKIAGWQNVELAVTDTRAEAGELPKPDALLIRTTLESTPVDILWWENREKVTNHDLIAWVEERRRHLPKHLQHWLHKDMTSYDTEESSFIRMIADSVAEVQKLHREMLGVLMEQVEKHRFTVMVGQSHYQWAELQTLGKRFATWLKQAMVDAENLKRTLWVLQYSKLSGAIGNSDDLPRALQEKALAKLGFKIFDGATQIMPRNLYAPIGWALAQIVSTIDTFSTNIRLNSGSGRVLMHEPRGKGAKGSSRMPQKRNPIGSEQKTGMARMAKGFAMMIHENIQTWLERSIEQSCVERVAWQDLFFVVTHSLSTMTKVLKNLAIYPDAMLQEVFDTQGTYAASKVADFLGGKLAEQGIEPKIAYEMVQLAAWNAFTPTPVEKEIRDTVFHSHGESGLAYQKIYENQWEKHAQRLSLGTIISGGGLQYSEELEATPETVAEWNKILKEVFRTIDFGEWEKLFNFEHNLRGEKAIIDNVLDRARAYLVT